MTPLNPARRLRPKAALAATPRPIIKNEKDGSFMVLVPAGPFLMGEAARRSGFANEHPQHQVEVPAFYLSLFPVTNSQYQLFIEQSGHQPPTTSKFGKALWEGKTFPAEFSAKPVTCVSWFDAWAYCRWARGILPSEAMWEKAARGTQGSAYPWGNDWIPDNLRWSGYQGGGFGLADVVEHPEGVSPYGLYQMLGNVNQWTNSLNQAYPYVAEDGRETIDAKGYRIIRGGYWDEKDRRVLRCSFRGKALPNMAQIGIGFRTARLPKQP